MAGNEFFVLEFRPPFRDVKGRFTRANRKFLEEKREAVRNLGREFVAIARDQAPKRSGQFARSIIYRTFIAGDITGFKVYSAQPLHTFIVKGTKRHIIRARRAKALRFYWERGPFGPKVYFFPYVNHPGTKKNPYDMRALKIWKSGARRELRRISRKYITELIR